MINKPKKKVRYCLTWLYSNLCEAGLNNLCLRHEISSGLEDLHIVYLNKLLQEKFISIFRTSRLCFRIRYDGKLLTAKTTKSATVLVLDILQQILASCEWSKAMSVHEYVSKTSITHGDTIKLYTRLK